MLIDLLLAKRASVSPPWSDGAGQKSPASPEYDRPFSAYPSAQKDTDLFHKMLFFCLRRITHGKPPPQPELPPVSYIIVGIVDSVYTEHTLNNKYSGVRSISERVRTGEQYAGTES